MRRSSRCDQIARQSSCKGASTQRAPRLPEDSKSRVLRAPLTDHARPHYKLLLVSLCLLWSSHSRGTIAFLRGYSPRLSCDHFLYIS